MKFSFKSILLALGTLGAPAVAAQHASLPDFGPNVLVLDPAQSQASMQASIDRIYATQQHNEFGSERNAVLLMPGQYHLDIPLGYYTDVRGVGASPEAVQLTGNVHADASLPNHNGTCVFWRSVENFTITPTGGDKPGSMQWAVSQAAPMRRMHIRGDLVLHDHGGWVSGGWMADTLVDGHVDSGPQQQWISRNSDWQSWSGSNWNMVFVGVPHAPAGRWPTPAYTVLPSTPVSREKPYLTVDAQGRWSVRVPSLQHNSAGTSWQKEPDAAQSLPLSSFYLAHPAQDTAATLNAALAQGKHLLFTPGDYDLEAPLKVTRKGTVLFGLGFATLRPTAGTAAILVSDVDDVTLASLLIDAGPRPSPVLVEVGPQGSHASHTDHPTVVQDVFFRDGGATEGKTAGNLEINSNHVLIDHTWIWRADHGRHVGWTDNLSRNGLVVNGNDVTAYGLFVEHHQEFQVVWNGERGRTYMYQSEIPYDPPNQPAWNSASGMHGWASYKVADTVQQHEAWGLGVYSVFTHPDIVLTDALEVPRRQGVRFHDMITTCLLHNGSIDNIVDDAGGAATCEPRHWPRLTSFP